MGEEIGGSMKLLIKVVVAGVLFTLGQLISESYFSGWVLGGVSVGILTIIFKED